MTAFRGSPDPVTGPVDYNETSTASAPLAQFLSARLDAARIGLVMLPVLAILVGWFLWAASGKLTFQDDAAQYLSTAQHLMAGDGLRTSVMYYDSQLQQQAPAVQTVWPGGFPAITAAMSYLTGLSLDRSLVLVAILAHLGTAILLLFCLQMIGTGRGLALICAAFWMLFIPSWISVSRGLSEPLYQLCGIAAAVGVAAYYRVSNDTRMQIRHHRQWLLFAGLAVMAAITVRYQGVALIVPLAVAMMINHPLQRAAWLKWLSGLAVVLPAVSLTALMFTRNVWITDSMTGGANPGRGQALMDIAERVTWLPDGWRMPAVVFLMLSVLATSIAAAVLWFRTIRRLDGAAASGHALPARAVSVYCLGAYASNVALLFYLCLTSTAYVIAMRYVVVCLLFLIPPCAALHSHIMRMMVGQLSSARRELTFAWGPGVLIVSVTMLQFAALQRPFFDRLESAPPTRLLVTLQPVWIDGRPALDWLRGDELQPPVIMSTHAHALSLLTSQTVVGVPIPIYTAQSWPEHQIHDLARRHGVKYLVAFRELDTWVYRDLINKMLDRNQCPVWLERVVANNELVIARIRQSRLRASAAVATAPPGQPEVGQCRFPIPPAGTTVRDGQAVRPFAS
jgi:hypothetical protein